MLLSEVSEPGEGTLVLFLISGGASAMLEKPLDASMTEADLVNFHQVLVHSGLGIEAQRNGARLRGEAVEYLAAPEDRLADDPGGGIFDGARDAVIANRTRRTSRYLTTK